jgi:hypothetical protein
MNTKDNKKVSDDFYDRINYYEARNIFSSNEPVNPNNRLYTDHVSGTHSVWNTIQHKQERYLFDQFSDIEKETSGISGELARSIYNNINKYTASASSTACRLCGYVGHLAYQCRNNVILNNKKKRNSINTGKY